MMHIVFKYIVFIMFSSVTIYLFDLNLNVNESPIIVIDKLTSVGSVSDEFLSIALDTSLIKNGLIQHINSKKFLHMAKFLAPAFLRIGGNAADKLIFNKQGLTFSNEIDDTKQELYDYCDRNIDNFTMSERVWRSINIFCEESGLKLIFDLNVLLRNEEKWDTGNAEDLLLYSRHFHHDIVWQLGNEPNAFQHKFGISISPSQLGKDFQELRRLLNKFPKFKKSMIIGPDITRPHHLGQDPISYLNDFLTSVGNSTINAVTWHQYYLNGRTATLEDFINPYVFNTLDKQIIAVKKVVQKHLPKVPIWLSETSTAYGGGAPGLSNTFIAGFLWLDKLGMAALNGIDVVVRQTLYYGYYSMLDVHTLDPLPDWWLSVIYKKLVGKMVLNVNNFFNSSGSLRLYGHCSSDELSLQGSTITLFGMNLLNSTSHFHMSSSSLLPSEAHVSAYILTGCGTLTARSTCLNDEPLILKPDGTLPQFKPWRKSLYSPIFLPPYSIGFWTVHGISTSICTVNKHN